MLGFALSFFLMCTPAALLDFAAPKWKAAEEIRIDDAYKYVYQATRGGEHAAPSREGAKKWLDNEWQTLGLSLVHKEPAWEPLCPGGEIGRLNLRPFKESGGKADDVVDAFLASAADYRSETKAFTDAWTELGKRLKRKRIGKITHKEWLRLDAEMRGKGYPAIHHSEAYNKAYRPAYRIITLDEARRLIPSL